MAGRAVRASGNIKGPEVREGVMVSYEKFPELKEGTLVGLVLASNKLSEEIRCRVDRILDRITMPEVSDSAVGLNREPSDLKTYLSDSVIHQRNTIEALERISAILDENLEDLTLI